MEVLARSLKSDCNTAKIAFQLLYWLLREADLPPATKDTCLAWLLHVKGIRLLSELMSPVFTATASGHSLQEHRTGMSPLSTNLLDALIRHKSCLHLLRYLLAMCMCIQKQDHLVVVAPALLFVFEVGSLACPATYTL